MKLAIIGSRGYPYVYSGYETLVKELSERLVKNGVEVRVYCHRSLFKTRPPMVNGVKLVYIPAIEQKILSQLSHSFLSMLHCCLSDVDVILAVNPANGPFGMMARIFRKKTAINLDGLEWKRPKWKGLGGKYFFWASRLASRWYDLLINDSEEMRRVYLDLFQADSEVIAYGANIRKSENAALIDKWGLDPGDYYLIVGRLIPDNNADLIVEGFEQTKTQRKLVIVGDVPYKDEFATRIKRRAEHDPRLIFTGYVTDPNELAELYHGAFGYFHGHEYGGTNPTMIKAMAYGSAILALDTPFNQEMLRKGKFGLFFEKSATDVTRLIDEVESDEGLMINLKQKSTEGVTKKYDWDHVADQYETALRKLIGISANRA